MRLHRFYTSSLVNESEVHHIPSPELSRQLSKVFRLKLGDEVIIFDGSGSDFVCEIMELGKDVVTMKIKSRSSSRYMPERKVVLCASLVKKDTFEWIVEKATELGVTDIVPVVSDRSEKKSLNEERLKKIAIEASEQCGRGDVPHVHEITKLEDAVKEKYIGSSENKIDTSNFRKITLHTDAEDSLRNFVPVKKDDQLILFIGPEGGWNSVEIELFHRNNVDVISLGQQILRAETAVVSALSLIMLETSANFR